MKAPAALRRDPAPSRLAYRWNRLWLTPGFRRLVRLGVPVLVMALLVGGVLASEARREAIASLYADLRNQFQSRPEFMVELLEIDGATGVLADAIRGELNLSLPASSFDIDLPARRAQVETFDAVESAELRILPGGILRVTVTERVPAFVWRTHDDLWLIDRGGIRVARITARSLRPDLPLVAGEGADTAIAEAQDILSAAAPLNDRIRGLVRVADHRWDLVLDRDLTLRLPAEGALQALARVLAVHHAEGLLDRDMLALDLRNPRRPTVQLGSHAAHAILNVTFAEPEGVRP
jgi:cell division protein FtsQ